MRKRDDNKIQAIKQEAYKLVSEQGFDGFSIQKLAKAAGVSPATIYIYYKDREDLILNVWADAANDMAKHTLKNFDESMPFKEGLRVQWINRLKYCLKYPEQMKMWEQIRYSPLADKANGLMKPEFKKAMGDFVHKAIRNKELVDVPLEVYWSIAYAPLYTLANFHQTGRSLGARKFVLTNKMIDETFALVIKALTP